MFEVQKKISNFATFVAVKKLRYNIFLPIRTSDNLIERQNGHNLGISRPKRPLYSVPVHIWLLGINFTLTETVQLHWTEVGTVL